jgi:hypothetical protein
MNGLTVWYGASCHHGPIRRRAPAMTRLALFLAPALLAALPAALPAAAAERFYGQAPRGYTRAGTPYYGSPAYYGRARSTTSSSSAYFPGFSTYRRVSEVEFEAGTGPAPRPGPGPAAPASTCGGWEVVNARPGEAACVGLPVGLPRR